MIIPFFNSTKTLESKPLKNTFSGYCAQKFETSNFFSKNACRALPCWVDSIYIPKRCIITIEEYIGYQLLRHDDIPSDVWENTNSEKEKIVKMLFMGRYYLGFNEPHEGDWQKLNV